MWNGKLSFFSLVSPPVNAAFGGWGGIIMSQMRMKKKQYWA